MFDAPGSDEESSDVSSELQAEPEWWIDSLERKARLAPHRVAVIRRAAGIGGVVVALIGLAAVGGLITGTLWLARFGTGSPIMSPWTAVCFIVLGLGIFCTTIRDTSLVRGGAIAAGTLGAAVGALFTVEGVFDLHGRCDNLFGLYPNSDDPLGGRPALAMSIALMFLGAGLVCHKVGRVKYAQIAMVIPIGIGCLTITGYAFGVRTLYAPTLLSPVAINSAIGALLAGTAILGLRADRGPMRVISGNTAGGTLARRGIPTSLLAPFTVCGLANLATRSSRADASLALAIVATVLSFGLVVATLVEAGRLRLIDLKRASAHAALGRVRELEEQQRLTSGELRSANSLLDGVLNSALDSVITMDSDGVVLRWNPAATALYGYTEQEAVGHRLDGLLTVYLPDGLLLEKRVGHDFLMLAVERGPFVYSVKRKDGQIVEVEARTWRAEVDGQETFTALVREVGEILRRQRELEEANRSLDEFTAVVAHDLRGPLTAIRGFNELLRDDMAETDGASVLEISARIDTVVTRGATLIEDLLAFAKAGRAHTPFPVDLTALVEQVAAEERTQHSRDSRITVEALPTVPGDTGALRQVFVNLIGNAVAYCPTDRIPEVKIDAVDSPKSLDVSVRVSDNGPGIPNSERDTIFDMFARGSTSWQAPGSGVGLAVCRRIVEVHGGSISVAAGPLGGARFTITLPRAVSR